MATGHERRMCEGIKKEREKAIGLKKRVINIVFFEPTIGLEERGRHTVGFFFFTYENLQTQLLAGRFSSTPKSASSPFCSNQS